MQIKNDKMESLPPPEQSILPATIDGIAIHLSYISKNINELNRKMDVIQQNTVARDEWNVHLKRDEDHENRIRLLETEDGNRKTEISNILTTMKVWGVALSALWMIIEFASRYVFK
jgi:hypothetical protein